MRFPKFMAALAVIIPSITQAQTLALDGALEDEMDANDCGLSEDERNAAIKQAQDAKGAGEELTAEEKRAAYKSAADKKAADAAAAPAIKPEGAQDSITQDQLDSAVKEAVKLAEKNATTRINALHKARRDVEPLVGEVALDSADDVYAFALKQSGVELKDVHVSAYPALLAQVLKAKNAPARIAMDDTLGGTDETAKAFPGLSRIRKA